MKRAFVSYTHDNEDHKRSVANFALALTRLGLEVHFDQGTTGVGDFPKWMRDQIQEADFVYCVCTETYHRRSERSEEHGIGLGAQYEGYGIEQAIYDDHKSRGAKFFPVLFPDAEVQHIPTFLRGSTRFHIQPNEELTLEDIGKGVFGSYGALLREITSIPEVTLPAPTATPRPDTVTGFTPHANSPSPGEKVTDPDLNGDPSSGRTASVTVFPARSVRIQREYERRLAASRYRFDVVGWGLQHLREDYGLKLIDLSHRIQIRILLADVADPFTLELTHQQDAQENNPIGQIEREVRAWRSIAELAREAPLSLVLYKGHPGNSYFRVDDEAFFGPFLRGNVSRNAPTMLTTTAETDLFTLLEDSFQASLQTARPYDL